MSTMQEFQIHFTRRSDYMVGSVTADTAVRLNERDLAAGLFRSLSPRASDLLRIGLAVCAVDRLARRCWQGQSGGRRSLKVDIAVVEPDFWRDEGVLSPLRKAIELLSSDEWSFGFQGRRPDIDYLGCQSERCPRICLYSGGLDSAAGLATRLATCNEPLQPVVVRHQALQKSRVLNHLKRLSCHFGLQLDPIVVKTALLRPPALRVQESTQRCRSFLFAALAGAAACAVHSSEIEVYESGVGAVNVPLIHGMATGARTTKSSHPHFLRLMSGLVSLMEDRRIDYTLPHRNRTKAELVQTLSDIGLADLATSTVSCVRYPVRGKAKQCGYCPACIGRRQAMILAGIAESYGTYECDLFGEGHIVNAVGLDRLTSLKATLMQVERLGELTRESLPEWFLRFALGTNVEPSVDGLKTWVEVLLRYRAEWFRLLAIGESKKWKWARWLPVSSAA